MTGKKRHETLVGIRQNRAKGDPLRRMFQDEARFGRINDVRRCWAPKPLRPPGQARRTHEYTQAYAAVEAKSGELDSLILPHVNTACRQLFLDEVGARHPTKKLLGGWTAPDGTPVAYSNRRKT